MKVKRLTFLSLVVLGLAVIAPSSLQAAGYPDHPIQLVITNVAGAQVDITGRMIAEEMGQILGQKIIPNNKPGAGTVLGTDFVIRSKKDGYTLLYGSASGFERNLSSDFSKIST